MIVKLRRDIYLDGYFFKARSGGVEIPDTINGKTVVMHSEKDVPNSLRLPKDAIRLDAPKPKKEAKAVPTALSEFTKAQNEQKGFVEAMKKTDDDED